MAKKTLILLLLLIPAAACESLKTSWDNFNARYNAYYNANKSFNEGFEKIKNVKTEYNYETPVRIHEEPVNAGAQDFEKAIDKGADVLRKHPESKWVDPSLLIIGKAYYFRKEYYSAEQKFQELYQTAKNDGFLQQAVLWQGRVYLDMGFYERGTQYLNEQLVLLEDTWNKKYLSHTRAVLAELYVKLEKWDLAITQLEMAVPGLDEKMYRERGYFLMGQIYDLLNQPGPALAAYQKVTGHYYDYNLQYLAKLKKAQNSRLLGNYEAALAAFREMARDDKNVEFRPELNYETARTLQQMEAYGPAQKVYIEILADKFQRPKPEVLAKTYYGLAEIEHHGFDNFKMAAAYYDTASRQNAPADRLPQNWQARELADSFGSYTDLKEKIRMKDSLLWVANLPEDDFEALVISLRQKRLQELLAEQREKERRDNVLVNVGTPESSSSQSSNNGFLNVRNPDLITEGKAQFKAVWGDRMLADNWRVAELLVNAVRDKEDEAADTEDEIAENAFGFTDTELNIDISEVPFSQSQQDSVKEEIAGMNYQLGNLFFLALDIPDSAEFYFSRVIKEYPVSTAAPIAYYSISELNAVKGDSASARNYAAALAEQYPQSRYAKRLAEKFNLTLQDTLITEVPLNVQEELIREDTTRSTAEHLQGLAALAESRRSDPYAPVLLYNTIREYIRLGKEDSAYVENIASWVGEKQAWEQAAGTLNRQKKEAVELLKDTTLAEAERAELELLRDSTMAALELAHVFPYEGAYWDEARAGIDTFLLYFGGSPLRKEMEALKTELQQPEPVVDEPDEAVEIEPEEQHALHCEELGQEAVIRGGKSRFMLSLQSAAAEFPDSMVYIFTINQRGAVESYQPSGEYSEEARAAIEDAFDRELSFEPVIFEGEAVAVQCEVTFTFRQ